MVGERNHAERSSAHNTGIDGPVRVSDCSEDTVELEDLNDVSWLSVGHASTAAGPPSSLSDALVAALFADHSLLPICRRGEVGQRAVLRATAALSASLGACAVVRASVVEQVSGEHRCVTPSSLPLCLTAAAVMAWILVELESAAQYVLRRRKLSRSRISAFDPSEVLDVTDVDMSESSAFDSNRMMLWPAITEDFDNEVDATPRLPAADLVAEQLVEEFSRLAPSMPPTVAIVMPAGGDVEIDNVPLPPATQTIEAPVADILLGPPSLGRFGGLGSASRLALERPRQLNGPVAKEAGDTAQYSFSAIPRPPSVQSDGNKTYLSGRTGTSCDKASSGNLTSIYTLSTLSGTTGVTSSTQNSVLSITRNAPNMQVRQQCDLEALKFRYIQSIAAKRENIEVDQRLDCHDVLLSAAALDGSSASLGLSLYVLVGAGVTCLGLCIGLSQGQQSRRHNDSTRAFLADCWPQTMWEALGGWIIAIFVLDFITVVFVGAIQFRLVQEVLAARRDQRWRDVELRRMQKAEAMRAIVSAVPVVPSGREASCLPAAKQFNQHLTTFLAGQDERRLGPHGKLSK